jgi:hypothetical protein
MVSYVWEVLVVGWMIPRMRKKLYIVTKPIPVNAQSGQWVAVGMDSSTDSNVSEKHH